MENKFKIKNLKYVITEGVAFILGLLAFIFVFTPAVFEDSHPDSSIFQLMLGDDRIAGSPILIIGFVCLIIGLVASLASLVLLLIKKNNNKLMTILSVTSIVTTLIGSGILASSIFISGFTEINSALGFNQGQWGVKAGTFLVPIFGLLSVISSYPAALVILHEKDLKDKAEKEIKTEEIN